MTSAALLSCGGSQGRSLWHSERGSDKRPVNVRELYEHLAAEYGYEGSYRSVLRFARPSRRTREAGEYDAKPWWFRFGVRLARLTSPVL